MLYVIGAMEEQNALVICHLVHVDIEMHNLLYYMHACVHVFVYMCIVTYTCTKVIYVLALFFVHTCRYSL